MMSDADHISILCACMWAHTCVVWSILAAYWCVFATVFISQKCMLRRTTYRRQKGMSMQQQHRNSVVWSCTSTLIRLHRWYDSAWSYTNAFFLTHARVIDHSKIFYSKVMREFLSNAVHWYMGDHDQPKNKKTHNYVHTHACACAHQVRSPRNRPMHVVCYTSCPLPL